MGVYVGAGVGDPDNVAVTVGVAVFMPGRMDGIFEDNEHPIMNPINRNPKMIRAIRFMPLLILAKQRHVKHIV